MATHIRHSLPKARIPLATLGITSRVGIFNKVGEALDTQGYEYASYQVDAQAGLVTLIAEDHDPRNLLDEEGSWDAIEIEASLSQDPDYLFSLL
jgi:hypothetical protein